MLEAEIRSPVVFSNHSGFHRWSAQKPALHLFSSDDLMRCCAASTNGRLDVRCCAFTLGRLKLQNRLKVDWSRCPGSMARRDRDNVAPLRQSSADRMPERRGRLSASAERRHPVSVRQASLIVGPIRRVWALRHQAAAQCSTVESTRAMVTVRSVVAPPTHPEPASRLLSATPDVRFLRSGSRCRRYVNVLSNPIPRCFGSEQKDGFRCWS